jgi:hypothetical protein
VAISDSPAALEAQHGSSLPEAIPFHESRAEQMLEYLPYPPPIEIKQGTLDEG